MSYSTISTVVYAILAAAAITLLISVRLILKIIRKKEWENIGDYLKQSTDIPPEIDLSMTLQESAEKGKEEDVSIKKIVIRGKCRPTNKIDDSSQVTRTSGCKYFLPVDQHRRAIIMRYLYNIIFMREVDGTITDMFNRNK